MSFYGWEECQRKSSVYVVSFSYNQISLSLFLRGSAVQKQTRQKLNGETESVRTEANPVRNQAGGSGSIEPQSP